MFSSHLLIAQRGCGCPIPGSQAGGGSEEPGLEGGVPVHSTSLELSDLNGPFLPKPFKDSMTLYFVTRQMMKPGFSCTAHEWCLVSLSSQRFGIVCVPRSHHFASDV